MVSTGLAYHEVCYLYEEEETFGVKVIRNVNLKSFICT